MPIIDDILPDGRPVRKGALRDYLAHREVVTPQDFGAKADGIHDDSPAIARALAAAPAVYFPPTDTYYRMTAFVRPRAGQMLFGHGHGSRLKQTTIGQDCIYGGDVADVVVDGLHLDPQGAIGNWGRGIAFASSRRIAVRNCLVRNHLGWGVNLAACDESEVSGCLFKDSPARDGMDHSEVRGDIAVDYGGSYNIVRGNRCLSGNGMGIIVRSQRPADRHLGNLIEGNIVRDSGMYGIMLYQSLDENRIEDTVIGGNTISGVTGSIINRDFASTRPFGAGIYVQGAERTLVHGNRVSGANRDTDTELLATGCIGVTNCASVSITGNMVEKGSRHGIIVHDANAAGEANGPALVATNHVVDCAGAGILIGSRRDAMVQGNVVARCDTGIRLAAGRHGLQRISVSGNQVNANRGDGILADAGTAILVAGNAVAGNGGKGLRLADGVNQSPAGNQASGNAGDP